MSRASGSSASVPPARGAALRAGRDAAGRRRDADDRLVRKCPARCAAGGEVADPRRPDRNRAAARGGVAATVALAVLEADTAHYAARAGVAVAAVAVGDPRGRWGSCAHDGAIRYSWRLLLAPPEVRRATAAHEVAHRVHMNRSPAFHALVATLYGAAPPMRRWLRAHGAQLHWYGRSSGAG
ncbi:YgjP-like metallopeptidase domain-containing protein [Sphingomonas sp. MMS24-JH45]